MAHRPNIFSITWQNIKRTMRIKSAKENLIGTDQSGNKYFERPADVNKGIKLSRRVEPPPLDKKDRERFGSEVDEFHVPKVPNEWLAWLQKKRDDPPTSMEIEKNIVYNIRTQQRAMEIDKRDGANSKLGEISKPVPSQSAKKEFPSYGNEYEQIPGADEERVK